MKSFWGGHELHVVSAEAVMTVEFSTDSTAVPVVPAVGPSVAAVPPMPSEPAVTDVGEPAVVAASAAPSAPSEALDPERVRAGVVEQVENSTPALGRPEPAADASATGTSGPSASMHTVVPAVVSTNPATSPAAPANSVRASGPVGVLARPNYRKNPEPSYPLAARRRRQEGVVLLAVEVTAMGRAARVVVQKSSGFKLLDDAAVLAVRDWEFEPARLGAVAIESSIEVPVRFRVTE